MKQYRNIGGNSGIKGYEYNSDSIWVLFSDNWVYEYRKAVIGTYDFSEMCRLADYGEGLNGYIMRNRHIKNGYSNKRGV